MRQIYLLKGKYTKEYMDVLEDCRVVKAEDVSKAIHEKNAVILEKRQGIRAKTDAEYIRIQCDEMPDENREEYIAEQIVMANINCRSQMFLDEIRKTFEYTAKNLNLKKTCFKNGIDYIETERMLSNKIPITIETVSALAKSIMIDPPFFIDYVKGRKENMTKEDGKITESKKSGEGENIIDFPEN